MLFHIAFHQPTISKCNIGDRDDVIKNHKNLITQKHCIECPKLKSVRDQFKDDIKYDHIFSSCELEQQAVASLFLNILETRQRRIQEGLPGT